MDCCLCYWIGATFVAFVISLVLFKKLFSPGKKPDLSGKHVLVTGGSQGIGLSVAEEVLKAGAHVTLVARDRTKLEEAQGKLHAIAGPSMRKVHIRPFDVCNSDGVEKMVADAEGALGPIFMLVNCAGYATPARFDDLTMDEVKRMMDVNFFGTFAVTQAVVRRMKQRETEPASGGGVAGDCGDRRGIIVLTSSQGGLLGVYGFTAYAAAKAALIKFGEALHMEVLAHHVSVTVCVPPDTDTPGFERESNSKPTETRMISEAAGIFKAEDVARKLVSDALSGRFFSYVGLESFILTTLAAGMAPITHFGDYCAQVFLSGLFRCVSAFYLFQFKRIIQSEHDKRSSAKKRE